MTKLVGTPEEALTGISEDVYNIKIKCLACSESNFIAYVPPLVHDKILSIGEHSFPLRMIETVTVRGKDEFGKWEIKYKVDSRYFRHFFNEEAIQELEEIGLL